MTPTEKNTDIVTKTVIRLMNEKKTDSLYLLAGDQFKRQIDANTWKDILEFSCLQSGTKGNNDDAVVKPYFQFTEDARQL